MKNQNNLNRGLAAFAALALAALAAPVVNATSPAIGTSNCPAFALGETGLEPLPAGVAMGGVLTNTNPEQAFLFAYPNAASTLTYHAKVQVGTGVDVDVWAFDPVGLSCASVGNNFQPNAGALLDTDASQVLYIVHYFATSAIPNTGLPYVGTVEPVGISI